jgi:hypothetical protein
LMFVVASMTMSVVTLKVSTTIMSIVALMSMSVMTLEGLNDSDASRDDCEVNGGLDSDVHGGIDRCPWVHVGLIAVMYMNYFMTDLRPLGESPL